MVWKWRLCSSAAWPMSSWLPTFHLYFFFLCLMPPPSLNHFILKLLWQSTYQSCWWLPHYLSGEIIKLNCRKKCFFLSVMEKLPATSYVRLVDIWLIFGQLYPFIQGQAFKRSKTSKFNEKEFKHSYSIVLGNLVHHNWVVFWRRRKRNKPPWRHEDCGWSAERR